MVLGNSFGNNRGKKYLVRGKDDVDIDILYAARADKFNIWFSKNYESLVSILKNDNLFSEDSINDSYLRMYENILITGLEVENYKSYFIRSHFTNYMSENVKQNRFCELIPNFDKEDIDNTSKIEIEEKQKRLELDIYDYIFSKYNVREFELFKMYMSLKPAITYSALSEITGIKSYEIQRIVSLIKKDIRSNKEFIKRRKELL